MDGLWGHLISILRLPLQKVLAIMAGRDMKIGWVIVAILKDHDITPSLTTAQALHTNEDPWIFYYKNKAICINTIEFDRKLDVT